MILKDFKIGKKFWMSGRQYVCADVGTRCVVAVPYDVGELIPLTIVSYEDGKKKSEEKILRKQTVKSFKQLFPDALENIVIHWYDLPACYQTKTAFQKKLLKERKQRERKENAKSHK
jgi:hypothetical protein